MIGNQKIIDRKKGKNIINGLKKIEKEIKKNKFKFNKKYEDIHLNIEKRLFELIGDDAGYLHIARSRNDQVITDFKLWIKKASKNIVICLALVSDNLLYKSFNLIAYDRSDPEISTGIKYGTLVNSSG